MFLSFQPLNTAFSIGNIIFVNFVLEFQSFRSGKLSIFEIYVDSDSSYLKPQSRAWAPLTSYAGTTGLWLLPPRGCAT